MYAAISSATAEVKATNGETIKSIYSGTLPELFKGIDINNNVVSQFIWAVSHKSDALPNVLFDITKMAHGVKIKRIRSGFYKDGNKVYGNNLIPFIMEAMKEYKPTPRVKKESAEQFVYNEKIGEFESPNQDTSPKVCYDECGRLSLKEMADDILSNLQYEIQKEFERRAQIREKQARLQQVLELAEMSVDELKDLLAL